MSEIDNFESQSWIAFHASNVGDSRIPPPLINGIGDVDNFLFAIAKPVSLVQDQGNDSLK